MVISASVYNVYVNLCLSVFLHFLIVCWAKSAVLVCVLFLWLFTYIDICIQDLYFAHKGSKLKLRRWCV